MTPQERKAIRDQALITYLDAVEERKAHCGHLTNTISVLRHVVRLHDEDGLRVQMNKAPHPPTIENGRPEGSTLPSHETLVNAFIECQKAKQREELQYTEAINAGVDRSLLPKPGIS